MDLKTLRQRYGSKQVRESGGVISINGDIPASSLRSHYGLGIPESAEEIARWINAVFGRQGAQRRQRSPRGRLALGPLDR